jgi:osmotically-inducible protein OsmY
MKRLVYLLTLTLILAFGAAWAADNKVSDDTLYDQVRIKIAQDREVGSGAVDVKVTNGVVELTGNVPDEKHKQRVEKVAKKVKGVKAVENKLRIVPSA